MPDPIDLTFPASPGEEMGLGSRKKGVLNMKRQKTLTRLLWGLGLAVTFCVFAAGFAEASPRSCGSCGMFGVARGQIARINAAHIGDPNTRPIQVEMALVDAIGAVVARDSKTIEPGEAVFFDVPFDAVGGDESRIELRAVISGEPEKNLRSSVEVFDADTGKTTVFIGDPGL